MKYSLMLGVTVMLLLIGSNAFAQTSAQERAAMLRGQLSEIEAKQATLTTQMQELEERLKPQNIEQSLAGVGSTRPEDLREQKRRQLEIERDGVKKQIDLLTASRTRLEASISRADADAYRQSAAPQPAALPATGTETSTATPANNTVTTTPPRRTRKKRTRRVRRSHHTQTNLFPER